MSGLEVQVTIAALISFVMAQLKKSRWFPWLSTETAKANRIVAIVLSGFGALGVHIQFDHTAHTALITGLSLTAVLAGLWHWATQFAVTHGWFKATSASDQVVALLKTLLDAQRQEPLPTKP